MSCICFFSFFLFHFIHTQGKSNDYDYDDNEEQDTYIFAGCDLVDVLSVCEDDVLSICELTCVGVEQKSLNTPNIWGAFELFQSWGSLGMFCLEYLAWSQCPLAPESLG